MIKIVGTKYNVVEAAWRVVDTAMDVSGGYGMFKKNEVERLYRDCRAGRFPSGELGPHARIGGQGNSGHRPRRTAALGLSGSTPEEPGSPWELSHGLPASPG